MGQKTLLMYKDIPVCSFEYSYDENAQRYYLTNFESLQPLEIELEHMPGQSVAKVNKEIERNLQHNNGVTKQPLSSLEKFILGRGIQTERSQVEEYQKQDINFEENELVKKLGYARMPTDAFWIKSENSPARFEDVNPLNPESKIHQYQLENINTFELQETLYHFGGGSYQSWVYDKQNNDYYFVKSSLNQMFAGKEFVPIYEVLSSYIGKQLGFGNDIIEYGFSNSGNCQSKSFVHPGEESINLKMCMEKLMEKKEISPVSYDSDYELLKDTLVKSGIDEKRAESFLNRMFLLDALIGNSDRQFDNITLIRDSKTGKIKDVAPIYDLGNSFGIDVKKSLSPETFLEHQTELIPKMSYHKGQNFREMLAEAIKRNPDVYFDIFTKGNINNMITTCFKAYKNNCMKDPTINEEKLKQVDRVEKELKGYVDKINDFYIERKAEIQVEKLQNREEREISLNRK